MKANATGPSPAVKLVFGAAAFISVVTGLAIYLLADRIGIDQDTAQLIALAFLVAGFADYLLLRFWDRIFKQRQE